MKASRLQERQLSPPGPGDTSLLEGRRVCTWCRRHLSPTARGDARFCGRRCRQTAFRLRRRHVVEVLNDRPLRFAYADPPYPGLSSKYYRHESSYGGEVDHPALIASLTAAYDGWALSTSARALRQLLPLCPQNARVCAWVKPKGAPAQTYGLHNSWEPVIVVPGRHLRPGFRDWLMAHAARGGGTLPGRKPIAFCAWLFRCLGMLPGDQLVDLFPGTGVVGRSWAELSSGSVAYAGVSDTSPAAADDTSRAAAADTSPGAGNDGRGPVAKRSGASRPQPRIQPGPARRVSRRL